MHLSSLKADSENVNPGVAYFFAFFTFTNSERLSSAERDCPYSVPCILCLPLAARECFVYILNCHQGLNPKQKVK